MKGLTRDLRKREVNYLTCSKCNTSGGSLVKVDDHYEHSDKPLCRMMQLRVKVD